MRDPKDILVNGVQLSIILDNHKKWLINDGGERADLQSADLRYANLLSANLLSANLQSADLQSANLQSADLQSANLRYANLQSADLQSADLRYADLQSANLQSADLQYANLQYANLQSANLQSAKNNEFAAALVTITPAGDLVGWKKLSGGLIAKLLIPAKAKRSNATGRKCRAEFAKVLEIWDGDKKVKTGRSSYDEEFIYTVGKIVKADFDDNRWEGCSTGIHFFITRIEAENY